MDNVKGKISYERLDIGSVKSVIEFGKLITNKYRKIDILINNGKIFLYHIIYLFDNDKSEFNNFPLAGIMAPPFELTEDGFESQLAVNYLGHFLLTHLLLPQLKAAGTSNLNARIVNVSSCVHLLGEINMDDINGL